MDNKTDKVALSCMYKGMASCMKEKFSLISLMTRPQLQEIHKIQLEKDCQKKQTKKCTLSGNVEENEDGEGKRLEQNYSWIYRDRKMQ